MWNKKMIKTNKYTYAMETYVDNMEADNISS